MLKTISTITLGQAEGITGISKLDCYVIALKDSNDKDVKDISALDCDILVSYEDDYLLMDSFVLDFNTCTSTEESLDKLTAYKKIIFPTNSNVYIRVNVAYKNDLSVITDGDIAIQLDLMEGIK